MTIHWIHLTRRARLTPISGGPKPYVPTVIENLRKWVRGLFWEVHEIFSGGTRQETKGKNVDNDKRPVNPVTWEIQVTVNPDEYLNR